MIEREGMDPVDAAVAAAGARIAAELDEPFVWLIQNIVREWGEARAEALLRQTQAIEAAGGMPTAGGDARRSAGGIYLRLVKDAAGAEELERIFAGPKKPRPEPREGPHPADPLPLSALTWDEARVEVSQIVQTPMEKASVKITLVGRPTQVSRTRSCVVVAMKGSRPPSLPKGLPLAPDNSDFSYAVFIALKHWAKVAPLMANDKNERLLVEGYPIFDPKRGVTVILAQNVRTINLVRRARSTYSN
jgi:hypothetical protein